MSSDMIILFKNKKTGRYIKKIDFDDRRVIYAANLVDVLVNADRFATDSDITANSILLAIEAYLPLDERGDIVKVKFREVKPPLTTVLPGFR